MGVELAIEAEDSVGVAAAGNRAFAQLATDARRTTVVGLEGGGQITVETIDQLLRKTHFGGFSDRSKQRNS